MRILCQWSQISRFYHHHWRNENEFEQNSDYSRLKNFFKHQKRSNFSKFRQLLQKIHSWIFKADTIFHRFNQSWRKKFCFFMKFRWFERKSLSFVKDRFYHRLDIAAFWLEQRNMNWIRRFWLSSSRSIVLKKRKRCFTSRSFHVTKNAVCEMQLRDLW